MSFIIRAALVIGTLSYLALTRDQLDGGSAHVITAPQGAGPAIVGLWTSLPEASRKQVLRDGAAELVRRVAEPVPPSRDTLAEADRQPAWRGIARH